MADLDLIRDGVGDVGERRWFDRDRMRARAEAHWDPEIVYEEGPDWPGAATVRGRDDVIARIQEYSEVLGEMETEIESLEEVDDERALLVIRAHGHTVAGVPAERRWANVFTVRDAKLVHWLAEMDPERARRRLGL